MIRILTDSASDILPAEAEQLGVTVIPLNVTLEDGSILRDGIDMTPTEYYAHLASCRKLPTTSQPSPELFEKFYLEAAAAGDEVLGIKPLITIKDGKVAMAGKARGLPGAYVALFKKIEELGGISPDFAAVAGYSSSLREVQPIENYFRENLHMGEPLVRQIGCVIGTHAGPGAFGLAFFDKGLVLE